MVWQNTCRFLYFGVDFLAIWAKQVPNWVLDFNEGDIVDLQKKLINAGLSLNIPVEFIHNCIKYFLVI